MRNIHKNQCTMIAMYETDTYSPGIHNRYELKCKIIDSTLCILIFMYIQAFIIDPPDWCF